MRIGTYIGMFSQIKKNIRSFLYYLSTEEKAPTSFKNMYYDSSNDDTEDVHSNMSRNNFGTEPLRFDSSTED